jgi:hypothetical protein
MSDQVNLNKMNYKYMLTKSYIGILQNRYSEIHLWHVDVSP